MGRDVWLGCYGSIMMSGMWFLLLPCGLIPKVGVWVLVTAPLFWGERRGSRVRGSCPLPLPLAPWGLGVLRGHWWLEP